MSLFESIILGIVQGLTEFLPVSSSGHLEIVKALFGNNVVGQESLLMTVILHAATALSTIVVFRKDIAEIFIGIFRWQWNEELRFAVKIFISMVPAGIVGLYFEEELSALFGGNLPLVGSMLLITGLLLFIADKAHTTDKGVGFMHSFIIGLSQAIAILPGISRSGATISTSVMLGIDRAKAARFSFLMVVPIILGKMLLDITSGNLASTQIGLLPLIAGFIAAFVAGVVACLWMIKLVKRAKLKYFAFYCFLIGILSILSGFLWI